MRLSTRRRGQAMLGLVLLSWLAQSVAGMSAYNAVFGLLEPHTPELAVRVPGQRFDGGVPRVSP
ncbi:hypothetical protein ACIBCH_32370 [Amycolatopsis thailandensis]|uniref:hypothetical protein n=1 Tax=Amycolatopsis thailandensis TaxID=589330 RepID=UPI003794463E